MPTVREASGSDVEACVSIVRGLPEFFTDDVPATVRRDVARDRAWVVEDESVVGFAIARERFAGAAEITWAAVENGRRHGGFGTKLIEGVLDDFLARGIQVVEVKTLDDSAPYEPYVANAAVLGEPRIRQDRRHRSSTGMAAGQSLRHLCTGAGSNPERLIASSDRCITRSPLRDSHATALRTRRPKQSATFACLWPPTMTRS